MSFLLGVLTQDRRKNGLKSYMSGRTIPAGWGQSLIDIEHTGKDTATGKRDGEPVRIGLSGDHDGDDARRALIVFIILSAGSKAFQFEQGRAQIFAEADQEHGRRRIEFDLERELLRERDADDRARQGAFANKDDDLITVPSAATIADNYAYIYRAKNCRRTHEQHTDSTEFLRVEKYSPDEIEELITAGKFQQAMHIMAWLLAQR